MSGIDDLPKGNGQTIYIALNSLIGIDFSLLCYEDYTIRVKTDPNSIHALLYKEYSDAFMRLSELGYKIIIDSSEIDENTFFFTPCIESYLDMSVKEYHKRLDKNIKGALLMHGINKPDTFSFDILSQDCISLLPFVIKNAVMHGGSSKYLISSEQQLKKLKEFLEKYGLEAFFSKFMVIQKYVETPTEYNTSLRILVSSSGDILYAALKYAEVKEVGSGNFDDNSDMFDYYLLNKNSPYFLGGKTIASNTLAGGNNILLEESGYSELERQILIAHGIDPDNSLVPEEIRLACQEVMKNCGKELGAICGMDFIYDVKTGKWKYLEQHEYPMLHSYAMKYQLPHTPTEFRSDGDVVLDLIARMHSLSMAMKKKENSYYPKQLIQET